VGIAIAQSISQFLAGVLVRFVLRGRNVLCSIFHEPFAENGCRNCAVHFREKLALTQDFIQRFERQALILPTIGERISLAIYLGDSSLGLLVRPYRNSARRHRKPRIYRKLY
jgi:hypothetical protein